MKTKRVSSSKRRRKRRNNQSRKVWKSILCLLGGVILCFVCSRAIHTNDTKQEPQKSIGNEEMLSTETPEDSEGVKEHTDISDDTSSEETVPKELPEEVNPAEQLLDEMTLEERIYQMFIVTQEQLTGVATVTQSGETTKNAIEAKPVGGIIYFSKNLVSREQCITMIENIQSYSKTGLFISVDEEGGTVARVAKNASMETTSFPSMQVIGDTGETSNAYEVGYTIGKEIAELGFNLDFAPVADVYSNPENTVIGSRAFGSDAERAASMVTACVQGFQDSEMLCTLKHFPGHGDTSQDSHYGEAEVTKTLEELYACELIPFQAGIDAGAQFVMVGHLTAPQIIDENVPATLSYEIVTGLLREEMGFQGIIITDSMAMQAITEQYSSGEAAVKAIQAGVDIILMPYSLPDAVNGILSAVERGIITEERINESVLRILELKIQSGIISVE